MTQKELERLVAEIPSGLKRLVDSDSRTNKQLVISGLEEQLGSEDVAELERKLQRERNRLAVDKEELVDLKEKIKEREDKIDRLQERIEQVTTRKDEDIKAAANAMDVVELNSTNGPVVMNDREFLEREADRVGCTVKELKEAAIEVYKE